MSSLKHYGMPRRSGRYPWGSGEEPDQRGNSFLGRVSELRKQGISSVEIAKSMGMTTTQLRNRTSIERVAHRTAARAQALKLEAKGYSNSEIGRLMGRNESSIRNLLKPELQERAELALATSKVLKESVAQLKYVDVGLGVENHLGISRTKLKTAVEMLKDEGYKIHYLSVDQAGTGKKTSLMALTGPDVPWSEVNRHKQDIQMPIGHQIFDNGLRRRGLDPIKSIGSERVLIKYDEDGGSLKDGVIELRRGVEDLSLGNSRYAQVRIGVDGSHFMKGMAIYSDDIPPGYDVIYNSNKSKGTPPEKVFKPMVTDKNGKIIDANPFGTSIKEGGQKGALNIVNEEGDWSEWSKTISSQVLSKQPKPLIKQQLDLALAIKKEEYEEISSLTNPAVKKKLLESFADDCDASAVHLKAAALPRQASHIILPFPDLKENQIYAPQYNDGELVVLIRHPHGGTFEIPQLTVNNKQPKIKSIIGEDAPDAVGIHPKVAEQLSGADFDGDTVLVIPTNGKTIKTSSPLKELQNFNAKTAYPLPDSAPKMSDQTKGLKMGDISNLITDMTIKGAPPEEIARAVKHSMVVIDAQKHHLNYKQSYVDNAIASLKKKYQGREDAGASTLISKASAERRVPFREDGKKVINPKTGKTRRMYVDPETGEKLYEYTGETYTNKYGKVVTKTIKSTKMMEEKDANKLSSGTVVEQLYANYANELKALANHTRKEALVTPPIKYSPSANKTFNKEVSSLKSKLYIALRNAPLERKAQLIADQEVKTAKIDNPYMDHRALQKLKGQTITGARIRVGASKTRIDITPDEWTAIQAGAISNNVLSQILKNTNLDVIKSYATPRTQSTLTPAKLAKAKAMAKSGHTTAEIAQSVGVSTSSIQRALD